MDIPSKPIRLYTIGHSNRAFDDLLGLLEECEILAIADIRRFPSSRKYPHFNQVPFRNLLEAQQIQYTWFEDLGGLRRKGMQDGSPNTGLKIPGFRNYADYMLTAEFHKAVDKLLSLSAELSTAVMCAERFYWKCHRRLLCDFLSVQGVEVIHILEQGKLYPHTLTPGAVATEQGLIHYPLPPAET
jgi:uncharacterized protein (DUF488 family)